jgi:hypothetical protein
MRFDKSSSRLNRITIRTSRGDHGQWRPLYSSPQRISDDISGLVGPPRHETPRFVENGQKLFAITPVASCQQILDRLVSRFREYEYPSEPVALGSDIYIRPFQMPS